MKRLFITTLSFTGLTIALYLLGFAVLFFFRISGIPLIYRTSFALNWEGGGTYQRFQEFNPSDKYDAIFLGSSTARQGYDPRLFQSFGVNSFNLGSSGQGIMQSYLIAKNYLNRSNTDLIILDLFEGAFRTNGLESSADLIQNLDSDRTALEVAWTLGDIRAINMYVLRLFSKFTTPLYESEYYVGLGFEERIDSVQHTPSYPTAFSSPKERHLRYFNKFLSHCQEEGITVILVYPPKPKEHALSFQEAFLAQIESVAQPYDVATWNFGSAHGLHSHHHFYDHHHLNQAGVEIFNTTLIQRLQQSGKLVQHPISSAK
ncbi:MAG: hypothetical protein AAF587_03360 [Bacteroidota bacterium]